MNAMSLAGRRGEVTWKKGRCYDSFQVNFGFIVPLSLGDLVHVWDIPATTDGGPAKGVRLRPDAGFKRRVLICNWTGTLAFGLWVGTPFLWAYVHAALGIAGLSLAILFTVVAIIFAFGGGGGARHRQIRLVLGPHAWGASDPGTWPKSIRKQLVNPETAFQVSSFERLANRAIKKGDWSKAMWAARLCVLAENAARGEELTDDILQQDEVQDGLRRVARSPANHAREFGKPPPLSEWLNCDPRGHLLEVD